MDMDVLHRDLLLTLASMPIEGIQQHGKRSRELIRLAEVLSPGLK
jgi:hypothetical protein